MMMTPTLPVTAVVAAAAIKKRRRGLDQDRRNQKRTAAAAAAVQAPNLAAEVAATVRRMKMITGRRMVQTNMLQAQRRATAGTVHHRHPRARPLSR